MATAKGHLDQKHKNKWSMQQTKNTKTKWSMQTATSDDPLPSPDHQHKTHAIYVSMLNATSSTGVIHSDLTGWFPIQSSLGNQYILVIYNYDSNAILAEPL